MGLTGVIYAIIVGAWACYLVPQALRRHDEAARSRSIDRFSSAMRVLSRRGSTSRRSAGRSVVTPARPGDRLLLPERPADEAPVASPRPSRAALAAAARRRRRVLVVLLATTALVGAVSGVGVLPWWSFATPMAVVIGFLVLARSQVRKASEAYWTTASDVREEPSNVVRRAATRVDASHGVAREDNADDEPTVTLNAEELAAAVADQHVEPVTMQTADGGSLWDPLPVTLPTYVSKPVAKRTVRSIDLSEPGTWSSGHSEPESATASATATATEETKEAAAG